MFTYGWLRDRSGCPLVTLGLVLDGSGVVRRSEVFAGRITEGQTQTRMLEGLDAPAGALVTMDRGIATEANLLWLPAQGYRHLVSSRERGLQFDPAQATPLISASGECLHLEKTLWEDGTEVKLHCYSERRADKRRQRRGSRQVCRPGRSVHHLDQFHPPVQRAALFGAVGGDRRHRPSGCIGRIRSLSKANRMASTTTRPSATSPLSSSSADCASATGATSVTISGSGANSSSVSRSAISTTLTMIRRLL